MKESQDHVQLWQKFIQGDRDAFTAIYNTYIGNLHEYAMRILKDQEQVEDCLHDLFTKLWANHKTLGHTDNIKFYLIAALRNNIISFRTRESRFQKEELRDHEAFVLEFDAEANRIKNEESSEQSKKIKAALDQLTGRQKEILYLKYFEELDYEQISELMNISVKGAYKLSARALEGLRAIMNVDKATVILMLFHYRSQLF
ncbi:sigma-70 family RNA polymerase sigma factor [Pedobacter sp. MC2016-14]|uniref:RNA polymerase sigma factor n=1 Tax=Pedobacter sp. MC2016-14 TaxID=2897327 RepID=UPI001E5FFBD3|nr:sigma-70 family RNA polymerase sigma factor [Pedobacter sp. MC2016-14]MCD0490386.1 sigma-70 family RNA polymerase sigma factor [Pedobacter sp. MC2016-14]